MVRFILPLSFSDSVMCFYSVAWLETVSTNIFATLGCSGRSLLERGVHNEKHYARANTFMVSCIKHKKKYMHVYNRTIYVLRPLLWCEPLGARLICRLCSNPALQFQTANIYFPLETDFVPTCYFESKNNIAQGSKTCYYSTESNKTSLLSYWLYCAFILQSEMKNNLEQKISYWVKEFLRFGKLTTLEKKWKTVQWLFCTLWGSCRQIRIE